MKKTSRWARPMSITPGRCTSISRTCGAIGQTRFQIDPAGFDVQDRAGADLPRRKNRLAAKLAARLHAVAVCHEPANAPGAGQRARDSTTSWPGWSGTAAKKSPRAVRFELDPGRPVQVVLEPWERRIVLEGTRYAGPRVRIDPRLGPRSAARPGPALAHPGRCRGLSPGHRFAELLDRSTWGDAPDSRAVRLDGQRLDRRQRARSARAAGRAECRSAGRHRHDLQGPARAELRASASTDRGGRALCRGRVEQAGAAGPAHPRLAGQSLSVAPGDAGGTFARAGRAGEPGDRRGQGPRGPAAGQGDQGREDCERLTPAGRPDQERTGGVVARRRRPDDPRQVYLLAPLQRGPAQRTVPALACAAEQCVGGGRPSSLDSWFESFWLAKT